MWPRKFAELHFSDRCQLCYRPSTVVEILRDLVAELTRRHAALYRRVTPISGPGVEDKIAPVYRTYNTEEHFNTMI